MDTYWVKFTGTARSLHRAVMVEGGADVHAFLQSVGVSRGIPGEAIPFAEFNPCSSCPHQVECEGSSWNEGRVGWTNDQLGDLSNLSLVHTCLTCGGKVLDLYDGPEVKRLVPSDCPRWTPVSGSALDCMGCIAEKDQLRRRHPAHAARMEAAGEFAKMLGQPKDQDELGRRRQVKKVSKVLAGAMFPGSHLGEPDLGVLKKASQVYEALFSAIMDQDGFRNAWGKVDDGPRDMCRAEWAEQVYLSCLWHPDDPEAVTHEFVLKFTDAGMFRRVWCRVPPGQRRLLVKGWEALVRRSLL